VAAGHSPLDWTAAALHPSACFFHSTLLPWPERPRERVLWEVQCLVQEDFYFIFEFCETQPYVNFTFAQKPKGMLAGVRRWWFVENYFIPFLNCNPNQLVRGSSVILRLS